jgi:nicotinate-nucleotide adenylyltransferase
MVVGLFFGSFNPVHIGHLIISNYVVSYCNIDQLWFVLTPKNPLKNQETLLNEYHRQHLIQSAIYGENKLKCSTIEFHLPKPSYTIDTLMYLKEKHPDHRFIIIMGSDSFLNLKNWKNGELIMRDYNIMIYKRPGFEIKNTLPNIEILDAPFLDISSSRIRDMIKNKKSIRFLVPDVVKEEIEANNYYKNSPLKNPSQK